MILLALKDYLQRHHTAHLKELSDHFQRDPDVVRDMLAHWIRKGKIQQAPQPAGCGVKCTQCPASIAEVYRWNDST